MAHRFVRSIVFCTIGLVFALAVAPVNAAPILSTFTGGDPGEGLDLQNDAGGFLYSVYFRNTAQASQAVGDVTFTSVTASGGGGVTVTDFPSPFDVGLVFDFGNSLYDSNLENVYQGGVTNNPELDLSLAVTPGQIYKLQILMVGNSGNHRPNNITIEGNTTFIDLLPIAIADNLKKSYVVTETFTAADSSVQIQVAYTNFNTPNNFATVTSLTLEAVPEPASLSLLAVGAAALLRRRKQR